MTLEQIQTILNNITYSGILAYFQPVSTVEYEHRHYLVRTYLHSIDPITKAPIILEIHTRIPNTADENIVLKQMRENWRQFFTHEVCECFFYKGELVFDPHPGSRNPPPSQDGQK